MKRTTLQFLAVSAAAIIIGGAAVSAAVEPVSRRDAARLQAKIDKITRTGTGARGTRVRTPVTETELNSYLRYELGDRMPAGVKDPWVSIVGDGRVSGRAIVDLNEVKNSRKSGGGMLDPYSYMTGSLPITIDGVLKSKNGVATFAVESAAISGVPMPVWMLQEIVTYYSRSADAPQGITLDKPFPLPSGIREIELGRGQAIVVQ